MALSVAVLPMSSKVLDISYSDPEHFEVTRTEVIDGLMDFVIGSNRGDVAFFFMDSYTGLNEPYLRIRGQGTKVRGDFGNDVHEVVFTKPIDAEVIYLLSREQVSELAKKGLFHNPEFRDFSTVPRIFPGNTLQIPVKCKFCYVNPIVPKYYAEAEPESSLLMVDVLQAEGIITTERECGYDLVEYYELSPMTAWELGDLDGQQYDAEIDKIMNEQREQGFVVLSKAPELTDQVAIKTAEAEAEAQASNDIYKAVSDGLAHIDRQTDSSRKKRLQEVAEVASVEKVSEAETEVQVLADEISEEASAAPEVASGATDFTDDIFASMANFGLGEMFATRDSAAPTQAVSPVSSNDSFTDLFATDSDEEYVQNMQNAQNSVESTQVENSGAEVASVSSANERRAEVASNAHDAQPVQSEVSRRMNIFDEIRVPEEAVVDDTASDRDYLYSDSLQDEAERRKKVIEEKKKEVEAQTRLLDLDFFADTDIESSLDVEQAERKAESQKKVDDFVRTEGNQQRALELLKENPDDLEAYVGQLDPSLQGIAEDIFDRTDDAVLATAAVEAAAASGPEEKQRAVNEVFKNFPEHQAHALQEKGVNLSPSDPLYGIEIPEDPNEKLQEAIDSMEPDERDNTTQSLFDNYGMI